MAPGGERAFILTHVEVLGFRQSLRVTRRGHHRAIVVPGQLSGVGGQKSWGIKTPCQACDAHDALEVLPCPARFSPIRVWEVDALPTLQCSQLTITRRFLEVLLETPCFAGLTVFSGLSTLAEA